MDDAQARRWLASFHDGVDALTDELVREAARLLGDKMDAQRLIAEVRKDALILAVERSQECGALWDDFVRRHGLTVKPPPRSPKGTHRPGEPE
jgi:hypothetical protein